MADKMTDAEDRLLTSMFAAKPIEDDGFSDRIVRKLRVRIWAQRLTLPIAAAVGLAVAIGPVLDLIALMPSIAAMIPVLPTGTNLDIQSLIPEPQTLLFGGILLIAGLGTLQLLDD